MIEVRRFFDTGRATMGAFFIDGAPLCFTLEDTATQADEKTYCIPPGLYTLRRVQSAKFGETFTVIGVPGHELLRLHWGNDPDDTEGCVLLGLQLDAMDGGHIWQSKDAHRILMAALSGINETQINFVNLY